MQQRGTPRTVPLLPEEAKQQPPSILGEEAHNTMTESREPGGSCTSADQTEYVRGETTMGEVGGGDDEPAKIDVRTRRRGGWHRWASPRAPSMLLCRTVEDEEEAG